MNERDRHIPLDEWWHNAGNSFKLLQMGWRRKRNWRHGMCGLRREIKTGSPCWCLSAWFCGIGSPSIGPSQLGGGWVPNCRRHRDLGDTISGLATPPGYAVSVTDSPINRPEWGTAEDPTLSRRCRPHERLRRPICVTRDNVFQMMVLSNRIRGAGAGPGSAAPVFARIDPQVTYLLA